MKNFKKILFVFSLFFLFACTSLKEESIVQSKEEIKLEELNRNFVSYITSNKIDLEKLYEYQSKYENFLKELEASKKDESKESKVIVDKKELSKESEIDHVIKLVKNRLTVIEDLKN